MASLRSTSTCRRAAFGKLCGSSDFLRGGCELCPLGSWQEGEGVLFQFRIGKLHFESFGEAEQTAEIAFGESANGIGVGFGEAAFQLRFGFFGLFRSRENE